MTLPKTEQSSALADPIDQTASGALSGAEVFGAMSAGAPKQVTSAQIATLAQAPIANGTATSAGTLTGAEIATVSRGEGFLSATLAAIATFILSIFTLSVGTAAGLIARTILAELLDLPVSVKRFGAVGDGVTDDTAAIQDWVNACQGKQILALWVPGLYRTTAPINQTGQLTMMGPGCSWIGTPGTVNTASVTGACLYANHAGVAWSTELSGATQGYQKLTGFGILRDQPAPAANWVPNANGFNISVTNSPDTFVDDVFHINATLGVLFQNSGRSKVTKIRGEFFQVAVQVDESLDTSVIDDIHAWPFWSITSADAEAVATYCQSNLDVLYTLRNDNMFVGKLFGINARAVIRYGQSANGITSKLHVDSMDADISTYGIWVDPSVTINPSGQIGNMTHTSGALASSNTIYAQGGPLLLDIANFRATSVQGSVLNIAGANTYIRIGNYFNDGWGTNGEGAASVSVTGTEAVVSIANVPYFSGGNGTKYSSTTVSQISVPDWRQWTSVVTAGIGTFGGTSSLGYFQYFGGRVDFTLQVDVSAIGTAANNLVATLPMAPVNASPQSVYGRESATYGWACTGTIASNGTVSCVNYDNAFPVTTDSVLEISGSYQ